MRPVQVRNEKISEIRDTLFHDEEIVVLLVEGSDDVDFFNKVFKNVPNIKIFDSYSGCEGLYDLLDEPALQLPLIKSRIVAVRDKDYTDPAQYPPRMFCYDYCALELMILHHPCIQEGLNELYALHKKEHFPLDMMRRIAPFSLLRQRNFLYKWGIAFRSILDHPENIEVEEETFVKGKPQIKKKTRPLPNIERLFSLHEKDYPELMAGQYQSCKNAADLLPDDELWNITNGHDICMALGNLSLFMSGALGEDGYRALMIKVLYRPDDFKDTVLYGKLSTYALPDGRTPFRMS